MPLSSVLPNNHITFAHGKRNTPYVKGLEEKLDGVTTPQQCNASKREMQLLLNPRMSFTITHYDSAKSATISNPDSTRTW